MKLLLIFIIGLTAIYSQEEFWSVDECETTEKCGNLMLFLQELKDYTIVGPNITFCGDKEISVTKDLDELWTCRSKFYEDFHRTTHNCKNKTLSTDETKYRECMDGIRYNMRLTFKGKVTGCITELLEESQCQQ